jgi:hypothetical protein
MKLFLIAIMLATSATNSEARGFLSGLKGLCENLLNRGQASTQPAPEPAPVPDPQAVAPTISAEQILGFTEGAPPVDRLQLAPGYPYDGIWSIRNGI